MYRTFAARIAQDRSVLVQLGMDSNGACIHAVGDNAYMLCATNEEVDCAGINECAKLQ